MEKQNFKGVPESNWVVGPCQTEEIAKQVLAVAHAYGYKWRYGKKFNEKTDYKGYEGQTCYELSDGGFAYLEFYIKDGFVIISPETFLANNPLPEEKPEEKTRKPGVRYTLEDWKKEADSCRKRAEYWKSKFQVFEKTANSVADSLTKILETHEKLKLDLEHTNKNFTILQNENKNLKESNVELRGANDEMIQNLDHLPERLELRTKGIQTLEEDARVHRNEIYLLNKEFNVLKADHEELIQDHEDLLNIQKWTKVVGWVGWIGMILCMLFIMFFKG